MNLSRRVIICLASITTVIAIRPVAKNLNKNEGKEPSGQPARTYTTEPISPSVPVIHIESKPASDCQGFTEYAEAPLYTNRDIEILAKTVWGEARGCTPEEQRLVVWTVLQRVDVGGYFGSTIEEVITKPRQFIGYREQHPIDHKIYALCAEEALKWVHGETAPLIEPYTTELPYLYFTGRRGADGNLHNYFREDW